LSILFFTFSSEFEHFYTFCQELQAETKEFSAPLTAGIDFTNICSRAAFSSKQDEKFFLVNSAQIWQMAHSFGKFSIYFSLKSGESIVGDIEWQFYRQTMCIEKKFGEIDPGC